MFARMMTVLTVLMGVVASLAVADDLTPLRTVEGITEYRLPNGLQILLFPDNSAPTVTVNVTVFVGSRHEGYGEAGMAHLLEHMLFKGTESRRTIPAELQKRGAQFNGTTWLDRTNYYETLPASDDNLEYALRMEADRLVNSLIRSEDLASEMTVVRSEFESGENDPQRILMQRVMSAAFDWHNYGQSTIGNEADIMRVPVENLRRFYQRFYQPDNAMVIVAGKFNEAKALELLQDSFGKLPKPERVLDTTWTEEPAQDGERLVTLRRVGEVPIAAVQYHIPAGPHPDYAVADILAGIMTTEPGGRLYQSLVNRRIAAAVYGMSMGLHDPGAMMFGCDAAQGIDANTLLQSLIETVETAAETPFTPEEVDRVRAELLRQRELQMTNSHRVAIELSEWAAQGDWRLFFLHRDRLEQVTVEDVTRVAKAYLIRSNRTAGIFEPTKAPERAVIPETPDTEQMLADYKGRSAVVQGEEFDVAPDAIETRLTRSVLPGGTKLTLLPKSTRGKQVILRFDIRYANPEALKGLAVACEMLPQLMKRGSTNRTRQQINDDLNNYRAELNISGTAGLLSVAFQTNRENLVPVMAIVQEILRQPSLPADEMETLRQEALAGVEQQITDPIAIAYSKVTKRISPFEAEDPRFQASPQEEAERLRSVTLDQVRLVHSQMLSSAVSEISVIGDFDSATIVPVLEEAMRDWKSDVAFARLARPHVDNERGSVESINTPDKPNAAYVATMTLPIRDDHEDYPALVMANFILGSGGLSSRLGDRVRQQDGLSYTIQSSLEANAVDHRAIFYIFAISAPENSGKVHMAIQEELRLMLKEGITSEELEAAKTGYLEEQSVLRTNDVRLAQILNPYAFLGRDMKFVSNFESKIRNLTVEDVNKAWKKHFNPKRLYVVMAGDFEAAAKKAVPEETPKADVLAPSSK